VIVGGPGRGSDVPCVCCADAGKEMRDMQAVARMVLKLESRIGDSLG
jgi:hypothetical protein